jgi:AmmeMemoRadiSam system protein A
MAKEFSLNKTEKDFCLALAKKSIEYSICSDTLLKLPDNEIKKLPKKLLEKKACFVTLKLNGKLRGCIGHLVAHKPLYSDIIENAYASAFCDPRYNALSRKELCDIAIEISVLTDAIEIKFKDCNDLLKQIKPKKDGLIISRGYSSATFLPSVWEEIKSKEEFLSQLCIKADLDSDSWKRPGMKIQKYNSIKIN